MLGEKRLACEFVLERPWERTAELMSLNALGQVPVLVEDGGAALADSGAITEYLEEVHPEPALIPGRPIERAEIRRLVAWFDQTFFAEVTVPLLREKIFKRFGWDRSGVTAPDIVAIRASLEALRVHLGYISELNDKRGWLAGPLSLADFAAAAHLSCVDYLSDVAWEQFPSAREWYARIKSRPCFRPVLSDHLPGMPPPRHYANLDF